MAVCLAGYRSARFMVLCGVLAPPVFGDHGVIAGCSIATTMIRVFGLESFDSVVLGPSTTLDVYIGDSGLNAVGTAEQI
eukprot:4896140-Pyramimonas_sp.AAC.1